MIYNCCNDSLRFILKPSNQPTPDNEFKMVHGRIIKGGKGPALFGHSSNKIVVCCLIPWGHDNVGAKKL